MAENAELNNNQPTKSDSVDTAVFSVALQIPPRFLLDGVLVRGGEDGTKAIDLPNWFIPYQAVIDIFQFQIKLKPLADGTVEM